MTHQQISLTIITNNSIPFVQTLIGYETDINLQHLNYCLSQTEHKDLCRLLDPEDVLHPAVEVLECSRSITVTMTGGTATHPERLVTIILSTSSQSYLQS